MLDMKNWLPLPEQQKIEMLTHGAIYPDRPRQVRKIETHLSWVFLTDRFAYKLRKPARYGALDYSTIQARLKDAKEEVRLNQRLAPDLYFGVIPLTFSPEDGLIVEGRGELLEWMIKMRRLPHEGMMDVKIKTGTLTRADIDRIGSCLALFYKNSRAELNDPQKYVAHLRSEIGLNYERLSNPIFRLPEHLVNSVYLSQTIYLNSSEANLAERAKTEKIIDGHGDLRPEHICLEQNGGPPVIFDCLQFDPNLRLIDPVDELSFLSLECERLGATAVNSLLFRQYSLITGDYPSSDLIRFYKSYRAAMWARLATMRTDELRTEKWGKWIVRANHYLNLAAKHSPLPECKQNAFQTV